MELVRGKVEDRPWGATLAALHLRAHTGVLTLIATETGATFRLELAAGKLVAASSSVSADSAVRVASAMELISPGALATINQHLENAPDHDAVDVIAEVVGLAAAQVATLRAATVLRSATRTFSIASGELAIYDDPPSLSAIAVDLRAVIYQGALTRLSDRRIADELASYGARFELRGPIEPDAYGFPPTPDLFAALRASQNIAELEFRFLHLGARTIQAIVYALLVDGTCIATEPSLAPQHLGRANTTRVAVRAPTLPPPSVPRASTRPIVMRASAARIASGTQPPPTVAPRDPQAPRTLTPSRLDNATLAAAAYQAGVRALTANDLELAVVQLTRASAMAPSHLEYPATLAWAKFCAAPDKITVAVEIRRQLSTLASREPKVARFYLGRMERMLGRDREALAHFRDVLSTQPTHTEAAAEIRAIESKP